MHFPCAPPLDVCVPLCVTRACRYESGNRTTLGVVLSTPLPSGACVRRPGDVHSLLGGGRIRNCIHGWGARPGDVHSRIVLGAHSRVGGGRRYYWVDIVSVNALGLQTHVTSNGVTVDQTPPSFALAPVDGLDPAAPQRTQSDLGSIGACWDARDNESYVAEYWISATNGTLGVNGTGVLVTPAAAPVPLFSSARPSAYVRAYA